MELVVQIDEEWQKEAVDAIARRFEANTPGVQVDVKVMPAAEIRAALYNGESGADIVQLTNGDIADCCKAGLVLDLRAWLDTSPALIRLFHPSVFRMIQLQERIAVLPTHASMKGIFYNKRWFDKAGIAYPEEGWTWEAFQEIAVRLQRANIEEGEQRHAARISFHWEYIGLLLLTAGTDWLAPDRRSASGYANRPEAVRAVQWAVDLVRSRHAARATQDYFVNADFMRNEVGMMLDYYVMLHEIQPRLREDLGVAGLPRFEGGPRLNEPWVSGFGISSAARHPELSWALLRDITCESNELTRLVSEGFIPALQSVYAEVGHAEDPLRNAVLSELANSSPLPVSPGHSRLYQLLDRHVNPALARMVMDGADVQETLNELAAELDVKLPAAVEAAC